jgi:hypothetical protein
MSPDLVGFLSLLSGLLVLAALAAGLTEGVRLTSARLRGPATPQAPTAGIAYVGFWVASLVVQSAAFVVTGVPRQNLTSSRYLLAGYVAITALLSLLARRGPRWKLAVAGGVSLFALSSIIQLARRPFIEFGSYPTAPQAQRVLAFARAHGVAYGYASYWQAPDLTWLTDFRLQIYPVGVECGEFGVCPWSGAQISSWALNRPGTRSMLISAAPDVPAAALDPWLGQPLAVGRFGTLTVAVYPRDIAPALNRQAALSPLIRVATDLARAATVLLPIPTQWSQGALR